MSVLVKAEMLASVMSLALLAFNEIIEQIRNEESIKSDKILDLVFIKF